MTFEEKTEIMNDLELPDESPNAAGDIDGGNVTEAPADDSTPNSIDPDHPEPTPAVVYDMAPLKTVVLSSNGLDLTTALADDGAAPSDDDGVDIPDDIAWDLAGGNVAATHHGRDDDLLDMIMEDMTGTSEKPDDVLTRDPDDIVDDPTADHGDTGDKGGLPDDVVGRDDDGMEGPNSSDLDIADPDDIPDDPTASEGKPAPQQTDPGVVMSMYHQIQGSGPGTIHDFADDTIIEPDDAEGGLPDFYIRDDDDDSDELPDLIVATVIEAPTEQDAFEFALPEPDPGEIGMSLWFDMA
ncbi:hypothetical protein [uncultured Roseobacter sp.]|uniref:hypothetical protein n=1 Tax=uncultured Roseobacter sp. TaxID=114847 RepID=UPI002612C1BF|nr:hypothetical protein [uncultured Roseobacter sp.]